MARQWLGYQALMDMAKLPVFPLSYRRGQDSAGRRIRTEVESHEHWVPYGRGLATSWHESRETVWVPAHARRQPDNPLVQAELALRHEPLNLAVLAQALPALVAPVKLAKFVRARPGSRPRRRLWFLYEFLTGDRIPLPDLATWAPVRSYVEVQDPDRYVAAAPGVISRRHGIRNNLLGTRAFCPVIQCSETLSGYLKVDYIGEFREFMDWIPGEARSGIADHLYVVETRDSFAMEEEKLDPREGRRFVQLLHRVCDEDFLSLAGLQEIQAHIHGQAAVAPGTGLRTRQNYIGFERQAAPPYVTRPTAPTPSVPSLMQGLLEAHKRMGESDIPPLVHAAAIAYGQLFIHPFMDGNSRTHRFLLHNVLAQRKYTEPSELFPLSARMLGAREVYAQSMYPFQAHIREAVQFRWGPDEEFIHLNDTTPWFRYPDLTCQAEQIHRLMDDLLEYTLPGIYTERARFLRALRQCADLTDWPSHRVALLVDLIRQNQGKLSKRKQRQCRLLDPVVVAACEQAVREAYAWEVLPREPWDIPAENLNPP